MATDAKAKKPLKTTFAGLIDIAKWQTIQDVFSSITEIGLRTIDARGESLTAPSGESRLCHEFTEVLRLQHETCKTCLPTFLGGTAAVEKNLSFICPTGFHNFVSPLALQQDTVLAYVILGPVILVSRKTKEYYLKIAEDLHIDPETFWSCVLEIRVLSFYRIQTIVDLIKETGAYVLYLAGEKISIASEIETLLSSGACRLGMLLDKFLNVALQISGAEIGSIMMLNKDSNDLTIRASKGLDYDVIKDTRVKYGEGISGTAVKEGTSFLIDDVRSADNRIKRYLKRPQLKSSMVLPIRFGSDILGVMSLGTLATSPLRFSRDDVTTMTGLIDLATLTLSSPAQS
jgi:putative methionine-R-sulfoxide reductase with GAF domain/ligand-binding sensor protein